MEGIAAATGLGKTWLSAFDTNRPEFKRVLFVAHREEILAQDEALQRYYEDFRDVHGVRPTAVEAYQDGYNPRSVRARWGSWAQFVATMGDLSDAQKLALELHQGFITALDTTDMVKSYKMLVLLAMIETERFPGAIPISDLADVPCDPCPDGGSHQASSSDRI
jgi:hypothetical protein